MEEDNPLGLGYTPTIGDAVQGAVNYLGGVARFYQKTVPQFLTGVRRGIKEEAEAPSPITGTLNPIQAAGELTTAYSQAESTALEQVASGVESLGLPEPVAGAAALAVSPFLPGPAEMGLVMKGGAATLMGLTVTDPRFIAPGVKPGIAQTPANIKAREMFDKSLGRLDKRRSELDAMLESGEVVKGSSKFARLDKKIREERYGEMSSFYNNLDQDPPAYRKKTDKNIDPTNEAVVLEQHHLAAKAQTQPFVEVMLEVGDPDDLVALHEYSRMLGVVMGNSRLNMLDAPGPIHRAALAKTETEKLGNIHSAFSAAGMEPNNKFVRNLLKDVKTSDDVMRVFSQYAQEYLIPQQNIAKKIVKNYFEDYKVNLTASQKARFNELVSKANKGGD